VHPNLDLFVVNLVPEEDETPESSMPGTPTSNDVLWTIREAEEYELIEDDTWYSTCQPSPATPKPDHFSLSSETGKPHTETAVNVSIWIEEDEDPLPDLPEEWLQPRHSIASA